MPQPTVALPESLAYYYGDRANQSALRLIMDSPELPPDLGWDEVLAYHDAKLAALKVRTDYCAFLHLVWQRTWGAALKRRLPDAAPPTVKDLGDRPPTLDAVWSGGCLHGMVELPNGPTLWATTDLDDGRAVRLSFFTDDGKGGYELSDTLPLGAAWLPVDDESWRRTAPGVGTITERTLVLTALTDAAEEAVDRLLHKLAKPDAFL